MTNEIKYASLIPLVGGMCFGAEKVLNKSPDFIVSYSAFNANDSLYLNYCKSKNKEIPYINLDKVSESSELTADLVVALCPCAGLSQLNCSKTMGANAPQNEWMYKSTEYALSFVKPKVLIGENAPALYDGKHGKEVLVKLIEIGKKYGYSFSVVKTNSMLHGVPQNRKRSFYYFWKKEVCPILEYSNNENVSLTDYFANYDKTGDECYENLSDLPEYRFLVSKHSSNWRSIIEDNTNKSLIRIIISKYGLHEYISYLEQISYDEKYINKIRYVQGKLDKGMNFRDWTPYVTFNNTATLTGAGYKVIHPTEDRLLTFREMMYLMGLPIDMKVPTSKDLPKMFQNVPSNTAAYWINEAVEVIKGNRTFSDTSFLKQNNIKKTIEA